MMKESLLIKPLRGGCKLILENLLGCRTMLLNHPSVRPRKGNRHTRKLVSSELRLGGTQSDIGEPAATVPVLLPAYPQFSTDNAEPVFANTVPLS